MKNLKMAVLASAALAASFASTGAQAATASANATANILQQVTVTKTADLNFGTIVVAATGANVAVSSTGTRTCGGALVCTGTTTAAAFNVTGTTGYTVAVSSAPSVNLTSGANSMTATLAASSSSIVLANSAGSFTVGGSLAVGANQADGVYTGSFNVTADYQ